DGMRVWAAGNTGDFPNVSLTLTDGFRIRRNNGDSVMWFDPGTGDIITTGGVFSDVEINAPIINGAEFRGGQIEITGPAGETVLSAHPSLGVEIGGGGLVFNREEAVSTSSQSYWVTPELPVVGGNSYIWAVTADTTLNWSAVQNWLELVITYADSSTEVRALTTKGEFPLQRPDGYAPQFMSSFGVPPNGVSVRMRYRRDDGDGTGSVRFRGTRIRGTGAGNVRVGGDVVATRGIFKSGQVETLQGASGIPWDPSDTGWLAMGLQADWSAVFPARRQKTGNRVWLSGEVICGNSAAGSGRPITTLPTGWRPARRIRSPWGWGDSMTYVVVETDGTIWSGPNVRTSGPGMSLESIPAFTTN